MHRAVVALALLLTASAGSAQEFAVRAARHDTIPAATTVTVAFTVSNATRDFRQVTPKLDSPEGWSVLMPVAPMSLAPEASELLMVSVAVPSRAVAGHYRLRLSAGVANDSVIVRVPERRSIELSLLDRPGYVVSGEAYDASFLLRNRGNTPARLRISVRSTTGRARLADEGFLLNPEETRLIKATVTTPTGIAAATDDVLEVTAAREADTTRVTASARVMIVPEPSRTIEDYLKVPTRVNLRAATSDAVSPFEIHGRGPLVDGSSTELDFVFRGPTGPFAAFGERDEYRVELRAPSWRVRAGDNVFIPSLLTASAQPGFGGGIEGTRGAFTLGGYGQQFRRLPQKGTETGAFVRAWARPELELGLNVLSRNGGHLPGTVGSAQVDLERDDLSAVAELAHGSASGGSSGLARSIRISGNRPLFNYDFGHQHADTSFAGVQRGAEHTYLSGNVQVLPRMLVALNAGRHRTDLSRSAGVPYVDRFDVATLGATVFERFTLEAGVAGRGTTISGVDASGEQHSLRLRADHPLSFATLAFESEVGRAHDLASESRGYAEAQLTARRTFRSASVSAWAERYTGGSITRGSDGTMTFGGDGIFQLSRTTDLTIMGYGTRVMRPGAGWYSQADASLSHLLRNGSRVTMRARLISGGSLSRSDQSVAFVEYSMPLRLPVSRLRTPGRVYGRVVDAGTGRGVAGALVRLGPQVAITDAMGKVAFGGVPAGEHRLSMSQETALAEAVFVGDPTLRIDSARTRPTTFELAIARSARLDIDVHRFISARTANAVTGATDSLVNAGPVANATLMLVSETDTLYRTTKDDGRVSFTDVPPGEWVLLVRGDAPAFHRFEPDRMELTLAPGEKKGVSFRLVPRKREVQIIGGEKELKNEAAEPRPAPAQPGVRTRPPQTGRPNERSN